MNILIKEKESRHSVWTVKKIAVIGVFIALSFVGALIKIPSPVGSIGMDSAPGYFVALAVGGIEGALVISIGHLLTAAVAGFPLTLPMHFLVAGLMALWALVFRWVNLRFGLVPAVIAGVILNGVVSSFTMLPVGGMGAAVGIMPFLSVASALNLIVAALAFKKIKGKKSLF